MKFDEIFYGTQYYRSPTPLENEWEEDIKNLSNFNIDVFQIRINWRNNERKENQYTFDDVDKLLLLAEKFHKKVVMKFLLECAPQYIYDKYHGYRIGPKGEVLRGGSHGAYYAGGWSPCFTNPKVMARAVKFVKKVTERYYQRDSIILWNAWNEPRNKPIEDCFCPECRKAFGKHLEKKYQTIENLNKHFGVCEESFKNIALPAMAHGYWDIYEFKKFKAGDCIYNNLKSVYDAIRVYDKKRPIISHSGYCAAFQNQLADCLDDNFVSRSVDMWGTSVPCDTTMDTLEKRLDYDMLNDYLLSISKDYFVYEIYPGLGMYKYPYDTKWDMTYKLAYSIGAGAKGLNFWQYRSERVGNEADCAGLARMDGSPREVLYAVKDFGDELHKISNDIVNFYKPHADIAIAFDFNNALMSEIEDCSGFDYSFNMYWNVEYYRRAHAGFYREMKKNNYDVDYLQVSNIKDIHQYKVVYFPCYQLTNPEVMEEVSKYVENGGILLADEGFGHRQDNTWANPYDLDVGRLFKARVKERRKNDETIIIGDKEYLSVGYHTCYQDNSGEVILKFKNGEVALTRFKLGKGFIYLFGFSLGYNSFFEKEEFVNEIYKLIFAQTKIEKLPFSDTKNGLEERRLMKDNEEYIVLLNTSSKDKTVEIKDEVIYQSAWINKKDSNFTIPSNSYGFVKIKKN